jgi:hypothetical protein
LKTFEEVQELLREFRQDAGQLRQHISTIMWHMRSMGREEAWTLSPFERRDIMRQIEERVKLVEKTSLPLL